MSDASLHVILACASGIYALRLVYFFVGQARSGGVQSPIVSTPTVSVLIPARNEEATISRCIASVQTALGGLPTAEIIIVNDRSTDTTGSVIDSLAAADTRIRPLHRTAVSAERNLQGKPGALQCGIDHASGEIILLTDADCTVDATWVDAMCAPFADPSIGMVCGFTTIRRDGAFATIQDVEWLYTHTMARAGLNNRTPLGCFGNNMALRRSAMVEIGGYRSIPFSLTEDLALLQAMSAAGYGIRYLCNQHATVETLPCTTFGEYVKQKHRWVRGGIALGWKAVAFVVSSASVWLGIVLAIATSAWIWVAILAALRIVGDGVLIAISALTLRKRDILPAIGPSLLVLLGLELILPFLTLRRDVVWKGQTFR